MLNGNLTWQARPKFKSGGIEAIVDSKLDDSYPKDIYTDMAEIALSCALFNKDDRPAMKVSFLSFSVGLACENSTK